MSTNTDNTPDSYRASTANDQSGKSTLRHGDSHFLNEVAEGSTLEVALSQLAVQQASDSQVRSYAQQLVTDHEKLNQQLLQLAQQKGLQLEHVDALKAETARPSTPSANFPPNAGLASTSGQTAASSSNGLPATVPSEVRSNRHYQSMAQKSGADFDRAFISYMRKDHAKDVKEFQKEAKKAGDPDVRLFASRTLPTLQQHLDRANSLGSSASE